MASRIHSVMTRFSDTILWSCFGSILGLSFFCWYFFGYRPITQELYLLTQKTIRVRKRIKSLEKRSATIASKHKEFKKVEYTISSTLAVLPNSQHQAYKNLFAFLEKTALILRACKPRDKKAYTSLYEQIIELELVGSYDGLYTFLQTVTSVHSCTIEPYEDGLHCRLILSVFSRRTS